MAKKKQIRNVLCFLVMSAIVMSALPVSVLAVNGGDNGSGDCAPVPDADLPEIYLNDTQEGVLSSDSGNDTNIIILTDVSDGTRETVSALGCDVYVKIDDPCCVGYCVYVDGVYQFTEGQDGTPDGYCAFHVCAGTHTIKITKNGRSASKANYFQCGTTYRWISMPHCWCENGGSDDCKYPPTVKFDKTKYYEGDTVHATVSTSLGSVYYKIKDCGGTVRKSGTASNGKKISYTIPKGASKCCYWQICFYWDEYIPPWMALAGAGGEVTALSYDCTKCYNFYVCPVQTCEVYVTIEDPCCVGYKVYVDGVYQFTEGGDGTPPDGYCAFHVKEGTHTLKITKNGRSASKTIYFECNAIYHWVRMPKNWCGDGEAYVEIKDKYCKGYEVYVDDVYQFTEGRSGTPDGNCGFFVGEGTKTIEIRKNGQSASLTKYFDCSYRYVWDSMPYNWCNPCADPPTVKFDKPKYNEGDAMFATVSTSSGSVNYKIKDCSGTVRKSGDRSNGGAIYYTIPAGTSECCNWQICFYWGENSPPIAAAAGAGGGEVTAQSYDCTKCYEFEVCPGEKPAPEIINVTYPIMCVKEGENATISVTVENKGGMSSEGYITVSFPNDEEVSVVSGTGNGYNKLYPKGFWPLWNSKGEQMTAVDPLAELFETNWDDGESHTLTVNVKPNSGSDEIEFLVRAALKNDAEGNYERDPTSGDTDQQGWYAKKYSVDVCGGDTIPVKFIGEITGEGTPISSYQFDVRVDEILSDPSGKLEVGETASVWAHGSTFTIKAGVGDRVEVLGSYRGTIDDMDKIQLENPSHFLEEQAYRWIKTDENAKFDCGTNNEYFNVSFYSDWLAAQIRIEAETGENLRSASPVLFWDAGQSEPSSVSKHMRLLDASKGMIELWPNKYEYDEVKGPAIRVKIYYRITTYTTEKDKFDRIAWISTHGDLVLLTGGNKDFVMKVWGDNTNDYYTATRIWGVTDRFKDRLLMNWEGDVTKEYFTVGDEINLDVPSGTITMKILELKWAPPQYDRILLEKVKVDYEIESEEALSADFSIEPSQNINLGDVVTFDVSSSTGDISSYDWDFGDRGKFSRTSGNKHFYMSSGTFSVTLTVKDNNGNSDSLTKTVNVYSKYENSELKISLVRNKCSQILVDYRVVLTKNAPLNVNVEKYSNGDGLPGVIVGSAFQNDAIMCAIPDIPKMVTSKCINYIIKKASEKADKLLGPIGWISNMIDLAAYIECIQGYNFIEDDKTAGDGNLIIHIPYESAELSENRYIGDETPQMSEAFLDTEIRDKILETENLQFQETPEQLIYIYKENTGLSKKTVNQQKFAYMKKIDPSDLPEGITFYYEPSIQKKEKSMPSHPKLEISVKRQIKDEDIPLVEVSICIIVNDMCQSLGSTSSDGSLRLTEDELVHIDPHGTYTLVAGDGIFYSRKKEQFTFNNDGTTHVDIVLEKKDLPTIPSYVAIFAKNPQEYPNIVTYPHANSIKNFLQNKCIYTEYIDPTNSEIRKNPTTLNEKMQAIISGSDWIIVLCSFEDIQKPFADFNPHFKFSADKKKPEEVEGTGWKIIKYTSENIGLSGETSQYLYYIVTEDKTNTVESAVKEFLKIIGEELGGSDGLDQLISTPIETSPDPQSTNFGTVLEDRTRTWGL